MPPSGSHSNHNSYHDLSQLGSWSDEQQPYQPQEEEGQTYDYTAPHACETCRNYGYDTCSGPIHEQYWHAQAYAATQTDNNFHHSTTTQTSHGSQYYSTREQEYAANYRTTTVTSSATPTEVSYNFSTKTGGTEETTESSASLGFGNIQAGAGHLQGVQGGLLGVGGGMNEHWHQNVHLGQEHQPPPESTNASNNWSGSSSNSSA